MSGGNIPHEHLEKSFNRTLAVRILFEQEGHDRNLEGHKLQRTCLLNPL